MTESKLGGDTHRISLVIHYFALAYCVSIVFAVILGATLGLVPPIDFWLQITAPFCTPSLRVLCETQESALQEAVFMETFKLTSL
ncbi:MAG: hypothetical protein ACTSV9_08310 [Candidatus Thorarchaeota archaeon]